MKDERVYMLNALWFKPDGGEQIYRDYMKAFMPLVKLAKGRKLKSFIADRAIIGDFDADLIYFVEFPSWQAFKDFANSADYHKLAYMREAALEKSLLIRCVRPSPSFN